MNWKLYPIIFRILSPIHVGCSKTGNLDQARPYITGKVLWAALTARLTRMGFFPSDLADFGGATPYEKIGNWLHARAAFGYFFVSLSPTNVEEALYPKWQWGALKYGAADLDQEQFNYLVFDSYVSTALDYPRGSAESGALHETEYIRPRTRKIAGDSLGAKLGIFPSEVNEIGLPVFISGYLMLLEERIATSEISTISDAFERMQFGAERRYGWGLVKPVKRLCEMESVGHFGQWQLAEGDSDLPVLVAIADTNLPAHMLVRRGPVTGHQSLVDASVIDGQIEPFLGRETVHANHWGRTLSRSLICWQPGTFVPAGFSVQVGRHGVLQQIY